MSKAFQPAEDRTEYMDTDVFLAEFRMELYRRQCDTLDQNGKPQRSPDRRRCHLRDLDVAWRSRDRDRVARIMTLPQDALKGLACENLEDFDDRDAAWAVHVTHRILVVLRKWVKEKMTEEVYNFYVYNPKPCRVRIQWIATAMDDLLTYWDEHNPRHAEKLSNLYADLQKAAEEKDRYYERLNDLPYWNEKDFDPRDVKAKAGKLHDKLLHVADLTAQKLLKAKQEQNGSGQGGGQKRKITLEEANIEVRRLLREDPSWGWTVRNLATKVRCSTGTVARCPAWKAYNERRDQLRKEGTIQTVSLSREMESVLGSGEKDEVVQQLIAEQEEDQQRDAGQAKLYLSHRKKTKGRES